MYCTKCGKPNDDDATFCAFCGSPLDSNPKPSSYDLKPQPEQPYYEKTSSIIDDGRYGNGYDSGYGGGYDGGYGGGTGPAPRKKRGTLLIIILSVLVLLAAAAGAYLLLGGGSKISGITIKKSSLTLKVGESQKLDVTVKPSRADASKLEWDSTNEDVAKVSAGKVTAVGAGSCTVTASSPDDPSVRDSVKITVSGDGSDSGSAGTATATPEPTEEASTMLSCIDTNLPSASADEVFPNVKLTDSQLSDLSAKELQFYVNTIFAKNGYSFHTPEAAAFFKLLPWYDGTTTDQSVVQNRMSSLDAANLKLLTTYRSKTNYSPDMTGIDSLWTFRATDDALSDDFLSTLSDYDLALLANTIYAKNGYIFSNQNLKDIFNAQQAYRGTISDPNALNFSSVDTANLKLIGSYIG